MSRPTELQYRSPHQKTPEFYNVAVTNEGRNLPFKVTDSNMAFEKRISFNTSQKRFSQYEIWSKNTSQFVGPGVYNDHDAYQQIAQQPCSVVYKLSQLGKEQGKPCYTMIGGNMLMYEPAFEKHYEKQAINLITRTEQTSVPIKAIFSHHQLRDLQNSRNAQEGSLSMQLQQQQHSHYQTGQNSQRPNLSFVYESNQKAAGLRPSTSYSNSRGYRSTQSQSRNQTKTNFSNMDSYLDQNISNTQDQKDISPSHNSNDINNLPRVYTTNFADKGLLQSEVNFNNRQINRMQRSRVNQSFQNHVPHSKLLQSADERPLTSQLKNKFRQHSRKQQITDLKKSVNLLQAYGEYERFLEISKNLMKEKGFNLKKQFKRKRKAKKQTEGQVDVNDAQGEVNQNEKDSSDRNSNPLGGQESATGDYQEINKILEEKLQSSLDK